VFHHAAPLLEEERHALLDALISDAANPSRVHLASTRAAFATDDHPVDRLEIEVADILQEGLDGKEAAPGDSAP